MGATKQVEISAILVDFEPSGPPRRGNICSKELVDTPLDALRSQVSNAHRIIIMRRMKVKICSKIQKCAKKLPFFGTFLAVFEGFFPKKIDFFSLNRSKSHMNAAQRYLRHVNNF